MLHPDDFYATDGLEKDLELEFGHLDMADTAPTESAIKNPETEESSSQANKTSGKLDDGDDEILTVVQMDILESLDRQYEADGADLHFSIEPVAIESHDDALEETELQKEKRVRVHTTSS